MDNSPPFVLSTNLSKPRADRLSYDNFIVRDFSSIVNDFSLLQNALIRLQKRQKLRRLILIKITNF